MKWKLPAELGFGWDQDAHPPQPSARNTSVDLNTSVEHAIYMNAKELRKLLTRHGCTFETHKGGSGHVTVRRGERVSQLPMHGSRKELGSGLVAKIKKDLGIR